MFLRVYIVISLSRRQQRCAVKSFLILDRWWSWVRAGAYSSLKIGTSGVERACCGVARVYCTSTRCGSPSPISMLVSLEDELLFVWVYFLHNPLNLLLPSRCVIFSKYIWVGRTSPERCSPKSGPPSHHHESSHMYVRRRRRSRSSSSIFPPFIFPALRQNIYAPPSTQFVLFYD